MACNSAVRALLVATRLRDILRPDQPIVTLQQDCSVEAALKVLAGARVLSAPVVTTETSSKGDGEDGQPADVHDILCFVDIRDILMSFLEEMDLSTLESAKLLKRMTVLEEHGGTFAKKTLLSLPVMGGDGSLFLESAAAHMTLLQLVHDVFLYPRETRLAPFGGKKTRMVVHRLGLHDKAFHMTHIVSQSDIARFLYHRRSELGSLLHATIQDLGWAVHDVISTRPEVPTIKVLKLMADKGISGVAIVNANGRLIGNFSISDLRTIVAEHFGATALPVGEFIAFEHGTEFWGVNDDGVGSHPATESGKDDGVGRHPATNFATRQELRRRQHSLGSEVGQQLVVCSPSDTFEQVLEKLVHNHLHRLYVVSTDERPIGIITLTDVLRKITDEATGSSTVSQ